MDLKKEIYNILSSIEIDFGGGCSTKKAVIMGYLIKKYKFSATLDIGVYKGRSFFPQAISHKVKRGGTVYGVDPYLNEEAKQFDNENLKQELLEFANNTDFEGIFRKVESQIKKFNIENYSKIVRKTSENAIQFFTEKQISFDLIHIDGNHDTKAVLKDIELYLPRLKKNGILILDDVSWGSVKPAYEYVNSRLIHLKTKIGKGDDFSIFLNSNNKFKAYWCKFFIERINLGLV